MTDFDKLLAGLEPAATAGESEWPNVAPLSIAVSLKRIADTLQSLLPEDPRSSPIYQALAEPLNHFGEGIGDCIQGQFERSQR